MFFALASCLTALSTLPGTSGTKVAISAHVSESDPVLQFVCPSLCCLHTHHYMLSCPCIFHFAAAAAE